MQLRLGRIATLSVATALLVGLSAQAQDTGPRVGYSDVSFLLSPILGTSVSVIPVGPQDPDVGPGTAQPAHLAFSISRVTQEQRSVPGPWLAPGVLSVFATADIAAPYTWSVDQLAALQTILTERPDPATFENGDPAAAPLPYISGGDAAQLLRARVHYLDTPQLSGIAYVAAFGQDIYRFGEDDFWYTFQGLTTDGSRYVSVTWVLTAPGFPARSSFRAGDGRGDAYERYLDRSVRKLNAADPAEFVPPLEAVDALVQSISFEAIPAGEPEPQTPAEPSAAASPAA